MKAEDWFSGSGELTNEQLNDDQLVKDIERLLEDPVKAWKVLESKAHRDAIKKVGIREGAIRGNVAGRVREFSSRLPKLEPDSEFHASLLSVAASALEIDTDARRRAQFPFVTESELRALIEASLFDNHQAISAKFNARKFLPKLLTPGRPKQLRAQQTVKTAPDLLLLLGQCVTRALDGRLPTIGGRLALGALLIEGEGLELDDQERAEALGLSWEERTRIVEHEIPNGDLSFLVRESGIEDIELVLGEQEELCKSLARMGLGVDLQLELRRKALRELPIYAEDPWVRWSRQCLHGEDEGLLRDAVEGLESIAKKQRVMLDWSRASELSNESWWRRSNHVRIWLSKSQAFDILQEELDANQFDITASGWIRFGMLRLACTEGEVRTLSSLESLGIDGNELIGAREACALGFDQLVGASSTFDWNLLARHVVEGRNVVAELKLPTKASASIQNELCEQMQNLREHLSANLQADGLSFFASHSYRCFERQIRGTATTDFEKSLIQALLEGDAQSIRNLDDRALFDIAEREGSPEAVHFLVARLGRNIAKVLEQLERAGIHTDDVKGKFEAAKDAIVRGEKPDSVIAECVRKGDAGEIIGIHSPDDGAPAPPPRSVDTIGRYLRTRNLAAVLLAVSLLWLARTYLGADGSAPESSKPVAAVSEVSGTRPSPVGGLRPLPGESGLWYSELVSGDEITALLPVPATGRAPVAVDALTAARWCKLWGEVARSEIESLVSAESAAAGWVVRLPNEAEIRRLVASGTALGHGGNHGEWLHQASETEAQSKVGAWVQNAPTEVFWGAPKIGFRYIVARTAGASP